MWSTWWVTADIPMVFGFATNDETVTKSMIDVHVVTGALTAIAITASIFGFILISENRKTDARLQLMGYSSLSISLASLLSLFITMVFAVVLVSIIALQLTTVKDSTGLVLAITLITILYTTLGTIMGEIVSNVTEGTLVLLILSFMDLMLLSNPMGGGVYLESWTYFLPGFWPVQLALESAFIGTPDLLTMIYPLTFGLGLILVAAIARRGD